MGPWNRHCLVQIANILHSRQKLVHKWNRCNHNLKNNNTKSQKNSVTLPRRVTKTKNCYFFSEDISLCEKKTMWIYLLLLCVERKIILGKQNYKSLSIHKTKVFLNRNEPLKLKIVNLLWKKKHFCQFFDKWQIQEVPIFVYHP